MPGCPRLRSRATGQRSLLIYLDTSFVVSLYSPDANSASAVRIQQTTAETIVVSSLTELEIINALRLRVFRKEISLAMADASQRNVEEDFRDGMLRVLPLPEAAFERARKLSKLSTAQLGTRTADLLHVAAALEFGATGFFSFDLQQRKLAQSVGLKLCSMPKRA